MTLAASRTAALMKQLKAPDYRALSGRTMEFDGAPLDAIDPSARHNHRRVCLRYASYASP